MTVSTLVAKENGSSKQATDMELDVAISGDGEIRRQLVRFLAAGEDRTETQREELEAVPEEDGNRENDFVAPFGEDSRRFVFGPAVFAGDEAEMAFEPAPGHEHDSGMTRGALAWSRGSNDPLWLIMTVNKPEKPLRELIVRMEFARAGETLYVRRLITQGRAKVLLMKRRFRMEMTMTEVHPAE